MAEETTPETTSETTIPAPAPEQTGDVQTDTKDVKPSAEEVVPEKYDLKLPEGTVVNEKSMGKFTEFAKSHKFTNKDAQALADMHLEVIGEFARQQAEQTASEITSWHEEVLNDQAIGGAKIDATMEQARKVLVMAKDIPGVNLDRLNKDLEKSGLTTHPDLIRIFNYFGQFIGDDNKFITSGHATAESGKDAVEVLYGEQKK